MADRVQISALAETSGLTERDAEIILDRLSDIGLEITPKLNTLHITRAHVKDGSYVGEQDVSNWKGHIKLAEGLGIVQFNTTIRATGRIHVSPGTGIKATGGIEYGLSLEPGLGTEGTFICGRTPLSDLRVRHQGPCVDQRKVA